MRRNYAALTLLSLSLLTGCGGGSGSFGSGDPATYTFITPKVGTQSVFSNTLINNSNNAATRTVIESVTEVNSDGSFVVSRYDPSGNNTLSNGITVSLFPIVSYNSVGQAFKYTYLNLTDSSQITCFYSPHASGAPSPLTVGQSWTFSWTQTCPLTSSDATQNGNFVGVESITVPAGTFTAYKFQSITTRPTGSTSTTIWRNASDTDTRTLKIVHNYTYTGIAPTDALASDTWSLQSYK
jgi:hypothetical protein